MAKLVLGCKNYVEAADTDVLGGAFARVTIQLVLVYPRSGRKAKNTAFLMQNSLLEPLAHESGDAQNCWQIESNHLDALFESASARDSNLHRFDNCS